MITFTNSISIHICARSDSERNHWADQFGEFFGNFTRTDAIGGWVGERFIETEPTIIITSWLPAGWDGAGAFCDLARRFQTICDQEAIGIQVTHDGRWAGFVIFAGDWAEFARTLTSTLGGV